MPAKFSLCAKSSRTPFIAACFFLAGATAALAQQNPNQCAITSGPSITPVVELFTSEGCSSCPPADKWLSTLKDKAKAGEVVAQAFHVGYWDYIGWVDRFAAPAHTSRQRDIAARNNLRSIYTPQAVLDGKDWPRWGGKPENKEAAKAALSLKQLGTDHFEASVMPVAPTTNWSAYWTVTEHGHNSKVLSGENRGEFLKHDFVVRQYTLAGEYKTTAATPGHQRQINLVVLDTKSGKTLQAVSLQCAA